MMSEGRIDDEQAGRRLPGEAVVAVGYEGAPLCRFDWHCSFVGLDRWTGPS